jgi:tripartite-type tricarboxylate transporter receptor subunit TctC
MKRRGVLAFILFATGSIPLPAWAADAATYPSRSITLIAPFAAGGAADAVARGIGKGIAEQLGQPVAVENRAGAAGMIGMAAATSAKPDGYTLVLSTDGIFSNPFNLDEKSQATLNKVIPVANLASAPLVLAVATNSPIKSIKDVERIGKEKPTELSYGTPGVGTAHHLAGALLAKETGLEMIAVPYRGTAAAIADLVSGQLDMLWGNTSSIRPMVEAGKARLVAVTSTAPFSLLPDVPTIAQVYPGFEMNVSYGVMAPSGVDQAIVARLSEAIRRALETPELRKILTNADLEPKYLDTQAYKSMLATVTSERRVVIKNAGINAAQ